MTFRYFPGTSPGPYELTKCGGVVVEQVIRPTGLTDPEVEVRPVRGQIDDLLHEIRRRAETNERVLVTTLTKRMAEDLAEYYTEVGVRHMTIPVNPDFAGPAVGPVTVDFVESSDAGPVSLAETKTVLR